MDKGNLILASASPRRIELFHKHGYNPLVVPADLDETIPDCLSAEQSAMLLALKKGLHVEAELLKKSNENRGKWIISADTIVYKNYVIGKPIDSQNAFEILKFLRNTNHNVITGVAILNIGSAIRKVFFDKTEVIFGDYSDEEIQYYIDHDEVLDKAGSYAIQSNIWRKNIIRIHGDYDNIVGFPWSKFIEEFNQCQQWNCYSSIPKPGDYNEY